MAKTMIGSGTRNNDVPKTAAAFRELLMKNEKSGKDGEEESVA